MIIMTKGHCTIKGISYILGFWGYLKCQKPSILAAESGVQKNRYSTQCFYDLFLSILLLSNTSLCQPVLQLPWTCFVPFTFFVI